jgi:hypothetical protein
MTKTCQLCHEPAENTQVIVYHKENNSKTGYLVMDDRVVFDPAKLLKFLYFCETKGFHAKNRGFFDVCENCLRGARVELN